MCGKILELAGPGRNRTSRLASIKKIAEEAARLLEDLPVALTDHIDRSSGKHLLRGTVGKIHSWSIHPEDRHKSILIDKCIM